MKVLIDIVGLPNKGDILIFDGKTWTPINKEKFLKGVHENINVLEEKILEHKKLFENIDNKLKEHHNILKELTKGE